MISGLFRTEEWVEAELLIYLGREERPPDRGSGKQKTFVDFPAAARPGDLTLPVRTVQNPFKPSLRTHRLPPLLKQSCNGPKQTGTGGPALRAAVADGLMVLLIRAFYVYNHISR